MKVAIFSLNFGASWTNIRPSVQLHAFYIAKMVFLTVEVDCAEKKDVDFVEESWQLLVLSIPTHKH